MPVLLSIVPGQLTTRSNILIKLVCANVWSDHLFHKKCQIWGLIDINFLNEEIGINASMVEKSSEIAKIHCIDDQIGIYCIFTRIKTRFIWAGQIAIICHSSVSSCFRIISKIAFSIFLLFGYFFCLVFSLLLFILCYQFTFILFHGFFNKKL